MVVHQCAADKGGAAAVDCAVPGDQGLKLGDFLVRASLFVVEHGFDLLALSAQVQRAAGLLALHASGRVADEVAYAATGDICRRVGQFQQRGMQEAGDFQVPRVVGQPLGVEGRAIHDGLGVGLQPCRGYA